MWTDLPGKRHTPLIPVGLGKSWGNIHPPIVWGIWKPPLVPSTSADEGRCKYNGIKGFLQDKLAYYLDT